MGAHTPKQQMSVPEHLRPQAPQLNWSLLRSVHVPLQHVRPLAQTFPQAPQLLLSVRRLVSQPSAGLVLQSANPELQLAITQVPLEQAMVALAPEQTWPQLPQLLTLLLMLVSQPSAWLPLQSAKPELQPAITQVPLVQAMVALAAEQTWPQPPQLLTLLLVFTQVPLQAV